MSSRTLAGRLKALRDRADDLLGVSSRARPGKSLLAWLLPSSAPTSIAESCREASVLSEELDRVGVHTSGDAELLRKLGVRKGRAGALARGLVDRADAALAEVERWVARAERAQARGRLADGWQSALETRLLQLARIVQVADLFSCPERSAAELTLLPRVAGEGATRRPGSSPTSPGMAIARFYADRGQVELLDLVRKRRDLTIANELLLTLGADARSEEARRTRGAVARALSYVRELPGQRSLGELVRDLKATREPNHTYEVLRGLYVMAIVAGQTDVARAAFQGAAALAAGSRELSRAVEDGDRRELVAWLGGAPRDEPADPLVELVLDAGRELHEDLGLASDCARYFGAEDGLSEEADDGAAGVRPRRLVRVQHPTTLMEIEPTGTLGSIDNLVVTHPGRLLYDLASARQLVRVYYEPAPEARSRKVTRTAVRVYVCDASGSMHGPRARLRDAILMAELNALRGRARAGRPFDPLYYSFFSDTPTDLLRVDSAEAATRHMEKLLRGSPAQGQTDITLALISAFNSIRAARGRDPHLARATVVLVTDGEDRVDLELLRTARAPVGDVDVALSFISLGEENRALASLVEEQRALGRRAFYQHLTDVEIASGRAMFGAPLTTLLPRGIALEKADLSGLAPHLEELERLAMRAEVRPVVTPGMFQSLFPDAVEPDMPAQRSTASEEEERLVRLVQAVGQAVALAPPEERAAEAVTLLKHVLTLYDVELGAYLRRIREAGSALRRELGHVRRICAAPTVTVGR